MILDDIVKRTIELSQDQYGNYVIQHVLEHGKDMHKLIIIKAINDSLHSLSVQKYSSNVIEKCFEFSSDKEKLLLVTTIVGKPGDP